MFRLVLNLADICQEWLARNPEAFMRITIDNRVLQLRGDGYVRGWGNLVDDIGGFVPQLWDRCMVEDVLGVSLRSDRNFPQLRDVVAFGIIVSTGAHFRADYQRTGVGATHCIRASYLPNQNPTANPEKRTLI